MLYDEQVRMLKLHKWNKIKSLTYIKLIKDFDDFVEIHT